MKYFDLIFNCIYISVLGYQALYFLVQFAVLKRGELIYYSLFLLSLVLYYTIYVFIPVLHNNERSFLKMVLSPMEMIFMVAVNVFYLQFLNNYLDLSKQKPTLFYVVKYYTWFNFLLAVIFFVLVVIGSEGKAVFLLASAVTMPVTLTITIMMWLIKTRYARVAALGITFASVGELLCHLLLHTKTDTYALYGGNAYFPAQVGVMVDVFILGYGLSLRNAESDKKLVLTLLENEQIVEVERSRLAKDLHDGLGGLLSGIKLTLHSIGDSIPEKVTPVFLKVMIQLDAVIKEMRRVAHNMMPEALLKFGLGEAIQDFCDGLNESHIIKMKYTQIGSLQAISQSNAIVLYRMIQELTNNALKHAKATNIFIQITKHQQGITITVEDDGIGFNSPPIPTSNGDGFKNLQTRIDYLKGNWEIRSEINNGTSVNIEIPV